MSRFDDIKVGDRAELVHVITSEDVEKFVDLTGDDNRIHVDSEYASHTTFKKPVVHGMLGASFISTVIGTKLPGDGALWFSQNLEFMLPVRVGDKITVKAEVKNKFEREKIIELQTDIFNQNLQKVTVGTAKVKIIDQKELQSDVSTIPLKKVALVIGAAGGIGAAVTTRLAKDGFDIALHYFTNRKAAKELEKTVSAAGRKCHLYSADITDEAQMTMMVAEIVRHFGTITVLVNCATVKVTNSKFGSLDWKEVQSHFDVNVKGAFFLAKNILPIMQSQKYGKIINFTTQYIEGTPPAELLAYVTAKSALHGLTKSLAVECAPLGITVNMISPGMTDTELIADIPEKTRLMTAAKTPLRRLAKPSDIAGAVSYLASESADFVTGETVRINGGQVML
jgi:3-oxoacyl-[acyl-carrier protein] reductase